MLNYFSNTPVYKIWIDLIDLVVPLFSEILLEKSFTIGDVICNRSGVHFFYLKNDNILELFYSQPDRKFSCFLRDANKNKIIEWKNYQNKTLFNDILSTKEDLLENINFWIEILKKNL